MDRKQLKTIDEYIAQAPQGVQTKLQEIRELVAKTAPEATEAISYGMPTFKLNGKNLVHFAAFKNHIGFYPTPSGLDEFEEELAPYRAGKGTAQFPFDHPLPLDIIKKIVLFRVSEQKAH